MAVGLHLGKVTDSGFICGVNEASASLVQAVLSAVSATGGKGDKAGIGNL